MSSSQGSAKEDGGSGDGASAGTGNGENDSNRSSTDLDKWERRLMTGDLPEDFLKVTDPDPKKDLTDFSRGNPTATAAASVSEIPETSCRVGGVTTTTTTAAAAAAAAPASVALSTEDQDHALALALQEQLNLEQQSQQRGFVAAVPPPNVVGRLTVTVVEARLARNYGIARMDPYARVRVGHSVYETPTCSNGAKEPKWNKTFNVFLLQGVKSVDVEIYDECTFFSNDALIAHGSIRIPEAVIKRQEVVDEWWPLSGQEGPEKEGVIHLILSLQRILPGGVAPLMTSAAAVAAPRPQQQQQQQPAPPPLQPPPKLTDEELEEFQKMFPNIEKDIIVSVFESKRGNKEAMVNHLLDMNK